MRGTPAPRTWHLLDELSAGPTETLSHQLQDLADRNPDQLLTGLVERARVCADRAQDATLTAQQLVLVTDGKPSEKLMGDIARTSRQAADATQKAVDEALDQFVNG